MTSDLQALVAAGEAPSWLTESAFRVLSSGYLQPGETPRGMWTRVSNSVASYLPKHSGIAEKFFDLFWKNWLCGATPVLANSGTSNLPISCFSQSIPDDTWGIKQKEAETAMLSKYGGGTAGYFSNLRPSGSRISRGGTTDGPMGFLKMFDSTISSISQGGTRRGSFAAYLDVTHPDVHDFLRMRLPEGDPNRQCLNLHHGLCIPDSWMETVMTSDGPERALWLEILKMRLERGEPYLFFTDTVNADRPKFYVDNDLKITHSNLCSEITLLSDPEHTFVCCLSSLNAARWEEWKDTDAAFLATMFLDGVMSEFLEKAHALKGLGDAVRFAEKSRALGLGVLGFHTLLQNEGTALDSLRARMLNKALFKHVRAQAEDASSHLADAYGEPQWCEGTGMRNTHLLAVAPTESNAFISGEVSPGIEPIAFNAFTAKKAKGTFVQYNPTLRALLASKGRNDEQTWKIIISDHGSVRSLDCLTDDEKKIFLTAYEVDQRVLVDLAAERQVYIDQSQSLNLFFAPDADPQYVHEVHRRAWRKKVKTLYYLRSDSVLRADLASRGEDCEACSG